MPGIDFRAARSQVRLADVLALIGFEPRSRSGNQVRGPCPVHRSRTPTSRAFAAHLGRGIWHCFRCGAGGNALDLWVAITRQDLHAAVIDLCARLGRDVPWLLPRALQPCRVIEQGEQNMPDP
jgi:DNA primase